MVVEVKMGDSMNGKRVVSQEALDMARKMRRGGRKSSVPAYVEGGFVNDRSGAATRALRKGGYRGK